MLNKNDLIIIKNILSDMDDKSEDETNLLDRIDLMIRMNDFQEEITQKREELEKELRSLTKAE